MPQPLSLTPEILISRLGEYLIEKGLITYQDLEKALLAQDRVRAEGKSAPLLGQILLQMGCLSKEDLDQAITEQILALRNALVKSNQQLEARVDERTRELAVAYDQLSELNQLKSNFVANISHELRTPLAHMSGYIELMASGDLGPISEGQQLALTTIQKSYVRLEKLIEDLIQFSMADKGQIDLQMDNTDLEPYIKQLILRMKEEFGAKGHAFSQHIDTDLPQVRIDRSKMQWAILHLLDNANKFTPQGGRIRIDVRNEGPLVRIAIKDTGIGIPADKVNEIFEPFHQLDSGTNRKSSGTGLGLSLVKKIIEAHGSAISVKSKVGKGSEFAFLLPSNTPTN
jgi:signal transduction histidine kinase